MIRALVAFLLLFPSVALGAGFAQESLFLSTSPVREGDTVRIYAVVQTDASAKFTGKLVVRDGTEVLGSPAVTLEAGAAQTVSVSWKPSAGVHKIQAQLVNSAGSVLSEESASFTIEEKPKPVAQPTASQTAASVESSQNIQTTLDSYAPAVGGVLEPVFRLVDGGREAAAQALERGEAWSKEQIGNKTIADVLKSNTTTDNISDPAGALDGVGNTLWLILATIVLYILSVLRWLVESAGVFYPVFALLLLYVLWKLVRRLRRPS